MTETGDAPCGSLEQQNRSLTNTIIEAAKKHIPRGGNNKPWKPFWTSECDEAKRRCNRTRRKVDRTGNKEDVDELQQARRDKKRVIELEKKKYWNDKCPRMNVDTDLFQTLKSFRGEGPSVRDPAALTRTDENGTRLKDAVTDKQKADLFCQLYAGISRVDRTSEDNPVNREAAKALMSDCNCNKEGACSVFTLRQVKLAIKNLKKRKSLGPDGMSNEMLKQLPDPALKALLALFNRSWQKGKTPSAWRVATIIPIYIPSRQASGKAAAPSNSSSGSLKTSLTALKIRPPEDR